MRTGRVLFNIMLILIGIILGVVIFMVAKSVMAMHRTPSLTIPLRFGNVIIARTNPNYEGERIDRIERMFLVRKEIPFFRASLDDFGKAKQIELISMREEPNSGDDAIRKAPIFVADAASDSNSWQCARYGKCSEDGKKIGEHYLDINFDGQFDVEYIYDDAGKKNGCFIYINRGWVPVDDINMQKAIAGDATYLFDPNSGWQEK